MPDFIGKMFESVLEDDFHDFIYSTFNRRKYRQHRKAAKRGAQDILRTVTIGYFAPSQDWLRQTSKVNHFPKQRSEPTTIFRSTSHNQAVSTIFLTTRNNISR